MSKSFICEQSTKIVIAWLVLGTAWAALSTTFA